MASMLSDPAVADDAHVELSGLSSSQTEDDDGQVKDDNATTDDPEGLHRLIDADQASRRKLDIGLGSKKRQKWSRLVDRAGTA